MNRHSRELEQNVGNSRRSALKRRNDIPQEQLWNRNHQEQKQQRKGSSAKSLPAKPKSKATYPEQNNGQDRESHGVIWAPGDGKALGNEIQHPSTQQQDPSDTHAILNVREYSSPFPINERRSY